MGTLCAGKGCRLDSQARRSGRPDLDLDATFRAGAGYRRVGGLDDSSPGLWSGASPTTSGWSRVLTRAPACAFRSPDHSPLLAQRAGAATANAGGIHHAQASISFSAVFVRNQLLVSRAPKRPIELASPRPGRKSGLLSEAGSGGRWTSGRGLARCLHQLTQARNAPRCKYSSTTSQAVNARCGRVVKKSSYTTPARVTPTGLFFLPEGCVATMTRHRAPSGPTGICGQS